MKENTVNTSPTRRDRDVWATVSFCFIIISRVSHRRVVNCAEGTQQGKHRDRLLSVNDKGRPKEGTDTTSHRQHHSKLSFAIARQCQSEISRNPLSTSNTVSSVLQSTCGSIYRSWRHFQPIVTRLRKK